MTNGIEELLALLREHGQEYVVNLVAEEMAAGPPADRVTTKDAIMEMYGDGPCLEIIDD